MRAKETLQLRHQLSAAGLSLRAAAYDTTRHHVLTFDAHPLRPHVLRLFSLRRELKSVALLEAAPADEAHSPCSNLSATQGCKRPSFFELQLQHKQDKQGQALETVVPSVLLQYAAALDVFVCVYSRATRLRGSAKVPTATTHWVVLLEPATLRKLLVYQGPETHLLQCAHYDPGTDRLVLASHLKQDEEQGGAMLPSAPKNVVEILQLSKRPDDWLAQGQEQPRTVLFIENTRASLRHPDTLTVICGSSGLRELYGAAGGSWNSTETSSVLLEWRQNQLNGGKLVLVRRVVLQHRIAAMAVSPCGDWLLAGFCEGGLRVWNVNGSRTNGSGLFTIDAEPFEPTGSSVADAQAQVISSIEITTTPTPNSTDITAAAVGSTDIIVIAVERDTGAVRHWNFSVERKTFESDGGASYLDEHRYPRLSLVGYFHAGGKEPIRNEGSPKKLKSQATLGPPLKTLTMCVTIDMGSCFENLLLVVREDVIHVLKVQTVLYVIQEFASIEETYAVRAFGQQDACQVISLSSTAAFKLRIFPLDETLSHTPSCSQLLFVTPEISAHVCSMETVTNDEMQLSFVVLAWSSGIVDVYDVLREKHVMKLRDKQLTDQISALSVVSFQRVTKCKNMATLDEADEARLFSSRSYGDLSQNYSNNATSYASSEVFDEAEVQKTIIVVGTESGKLYGWNAEGLWDDTFTFQSIQKANVRVQAAHSSHIIQLARLDAAVRGERGVLASVGAGGIVKLWSVPALKVTGYVNSVAEGYPETPSCMELMKGQEKDAGAGKLHVSVGYEDGRLGVWRVDFKHVSFQRMEVSTRHERRVTKICRISSDVIPTGSTEFLSCSLDMTVIQWQISGSGSVQEKRYFDIGAAIVDMVLVKEQAIVALAHEVCKFVFAPNSKSDMKYLLKSELDAKSDTADKQRSEQPNNSTDAAPLPTDDDYPDTPTTLSVDDPTEAATAASRASRPIDEYLTLHVPSAVLHLEAAYSTIVAADTATESAPATNEGSEDLFNSRIRGSKSANKLHRPLIDDNDLREYLQEYIARHGTGGTMAANRITDLLALRPELPSIKRPGFALAKGLKDLKLTGQTRVDSEEALQILRTLFAMSKAPYQSVDAPMMTRTLTRKEYTNEKTRAQRLREKKQARRKPVVTYNLLGEKYVRWEEDPAENEAAGPNQSPSSPTNSLVVHTPLSPSLRDEARFDDDAPLDDIGRITAPPRDELSSSAADSGGITHDTSRSHANSQVLIDTSTPSNDLPSEDDKPDTTNALLTEPNSDEDSTEEEGDDEEGDEEEETGDKDDNDSDADGDGDNDETPPHKNGAETSPAAPNEVTVATTPAKNRHGGKHARKCKAYTVSISSNTLMNSIRLSPMLQEFWTKGYCWCKPAPQLHIIWSDTGKVKKDSGKTRSKKCKSCHKRLHTVELPRVGYAPHFSRQTTFDIIAEVYSKLTSAAYTRLYKNASPRKEHSSECSIFSALFEVFLATYGMRSTAEMKLKLFFLSMCHFLPEFDAVAVFGELLGLHTSTVAYEYDQAPPTLVALCVCCYSWLYSRGMVVNGDSFSGVLRGREWGNSHKRATTEVIPTTDGTTHWQFVRIEHALLCAQDNMLYPLVSPGFLRNIMTFMQQECAQQAPNRSLRTDSPDFDNDGVGRSGGGLRSWVELHRFLRLLVGEWKHQNSQFRVAERLLFVHPQRDAAIEGYLLEKLRLLLSCFVFYDHERVGVMAIGDFETILCKLRYLWTEENMAVDPALDNVFDDAIRATKKRFLDLNHDGQLCYLDFWAMLYIVGIKTRGLIHFHELPSFCRDYRLEVSSELSDIVWNYMQLSCTLLLPKGLQVCKSSLDQKAERQHRRRVGGLHDGTFHFSKTLKGSLSTQELLGGEDKEKHGLFLDGSIPATRQTASTTALDRFRPVSVEADDGFSVRRGREPVVVGVRRTGPTSKPVAPLRVSVMGGFDLLPEAGSMANTGNYTAMQHADSRGLNELPQDQSTTGYTNMYIQFPQVPPVRRRVGPNEVAPRQIVANIPVEEDSDTEEDCAIHDDSAIQQENVQMELPPAVNVSLTRTLSSRSVVSVPETVQEEVVALDQPDKLPLEKRRSATAVVVVPTVEPETSISRASSQDELLKRESSRGLTRAVSERIRLEEAAAQLEAEKPEEVSPPRRQPTPVVPAASAREELPPESEVDSIPSGASESEVEAAVVEQSIDPDETFPQEEPSESVPIVVEEIPPEPEQVEPVPAEPIEPITVQPSPEEVVVESIVELPVAAEDPPDEVVVTDLVAARVEEEEVDSTLPPTVMPVNEPAPAEEPASIPDTNSEVASEEEMPEGADEAQYIPQVVKQDEIQIHHAFRFSQQPTFIRSVAVTNNPYRTAMWNPNDDSESDGDDGDAVKSMEKQKAYSSNPRDLEVFSADGSLYNDDEYAAGSAKAHPTEGSHSAASLLSLSTTSVSAKMPKTGTNPLKLRSSSNHLTRLDTNIQPHHRNKQSNPLEFQVPDDLEAIQDEGDDDPGDITDAPLIPVRRKRLDEDAERALYGERVVNVLGEGIAFSPEAEASMQQKWQQFFDDSESKMFAAMRSDLEKKQTEQREAEERQKKLRKKWQEQRDQDLLRLQNSRQNSTLLMSTKQDSADGGVDAGFRLRRIHRESCRQLTKEVQFGVSVQREFEAAKETQFFHFYYLPEGHGSIITLKMHVLRGDAEVFMSTDTKVPCSTDFMWRSSERLAKDSGEGHRIILYPHDLVKVVTAATANAASTSQTPLADANVSAVSLRSFYPKQPDATTLRVGFYLSVVALEPGTEITLAVMSSGQKMQPSRAIQTVDYLIDRFNMISRSFQGHSMDTIESDNGSRAIMPSKDVLRSGVVIRQAFADDEDDTDEGDEAYDTAENESTEVAGARRKTKNIAADGVDPQELKSFQRLLETLSEKKGFGTPRAASILLAGPSDEHLEFVQDEDQRLQEMNRRLSPPKTSPDGLHDSILVVTERRLTLQGKRQKLRRVVAARLQQKLAPLRHKSVAGGELEKSASTGALINIQLAKTTPRPVAYSITTLDPLPRSLRFKAATASLSQTRRNTCAEKEATDQTQSLPKG